MAAYRKASPREPSKPARDLDDGHVLVISSGDHVVTINLGKLHDLRQRLAQFKPTGPVPA